MTVNVYLLTYNRAAYLGETIQSVLNQTYTDFSLYILDNGSQDDTPEVVRSFQDERIHYIRHSRNMGSNYNFNYAIDHCQADYLVIFHDDDLMLPDFLESELHVMTDERADLVSGNAVKFGADKGLLKKQGKEEIQRYKENDLFRIFMRKGRFLVFPSLMYRKVFLDQHGIRGKEEPGPSGDVVLYFDIERNGGKVCEISRPIMKYRIHEQQDSSLNKYPMHVQLFRYFRTNEDYCELYTAEKAGRKHWHRVFSRLLFKDWMNGIISREKADQYHHDLSKELMIDSSNLWKRLYDSGGKSPLVRTGLKQMLNSYKKVRKVLSGDKS